MPMPEPTVNRARVPLLHLSGGPDEDIRVTLGPMPDAPCLIGLDFGSESARGVLVDAGSGRLVGRAEVPYPHGIMTHALPGGAPIPPGFILQDANDYLEAAGHLLGTLGRGRHIAGIGVAFTASSPLPTLADGTPLSHVRPRDPHAWVKLWKHSAQRQADEINARGGAWLANVGNRLSGEWLIPKAAEIAQTAPATWAAAERFIEAGDWLVWRLTGTECRSLDFAAFKAQHLPDAGYPRGIVEGLESRLAEPVPLGTAAGSLAGAWRERTGIAGEAIVAVALIDSHAVLPAVGAVTDGCLCSSLGTSAAHLALAREPHALPPGIEGMAFDAPVPGLWCLEAGQAGFGDALGWFVRAFPRSGDPAIDFPILEREAAALGPGADEGLVALDWLAGNRVPHADSSLRGLVAGLSTRTSAAGLYRALIDSLCFGARRTVELLVAGGIDGRRHVVTSGLAHRSALLVQSLADALGHELEVPRIDEPTAVGAAIHAAVAAGVVGDWAEGAARFGAREFRHVAPDEARSRACEPLYARYLALSESDVVRRESRAPDVVAASDETPCDDR